ncbi:branched-chain amino acid ABC transporter permease [Halobacteriales archaeon QS_8_69_26]|nr:MAG: branched-chain amino acid ABC transporter permease [Halobacteriales archaeon QS_8_69_26]
MQAAPLASAVEILLDFLDPGTIIQVLINGLAKSSVFVMIAVGLTLVFGLMGVLNFAHGSLTMIGAYLGGALVLFAVSPSMGDFTRLGAFFVVVVAVLALLTALGAALEISLIRPLYDRPPLYQILLTFGLTLVFDEIVRIVLEIYDIQPTTKWQAPLNTRPSFMGQESQRTLDWLFGVRVDGMQVFEIVFGFVVVVGIWLFLTRTRYGLYIRAGSEDTEMTEALGIDVGQAFTVVFGLGVGLAGVAGALLMWDPIRGGASVPLGADVLLPAFVVVIVGGLGTYRGTVVAALIVGMTDATMTWLFDNHVEFAGLPELVVFLILVIVLIVKPQGLFGVKEVGGH